MKWIYICLHTLILLLGIHGKPYSIHVSIHYPKGSKTPEVYVSEGDKPNSIDDETVVDKNSVSLEQPLENPAQPTRQDNPSTGSIDNRFNVKSDSQIVVPTDTEKFHMKQAAERYNKQQKLPEQQESTDIEIGSPTDLEKPQNDIQNKQKRHFKETYWNYKHTPVKKSAGRRVSTPGRKVASSGRRVKSSQTYDMEEVKAYERLGNDRLEEEAEPNYKVPVTPEYREGDVETGPGYRYDYEDAPTPNGRGPAEKADKQKRPYNDLADDYESYQPYGYRSKDDSKDATIKKFDYKTFDPYHDLKKNFKVAYKEYPLLKGCVQVGQMMLNPEDRCGYLECIHAEEQHPTQDLIAQKRKCAPGTAVPYSWRGGLDNPCTEAAAYCRNVHEVEDIEEIPPPNDHAKLNDEKALDTEAEE